MKQITAAEFRAAVELDPAWASKLTDSVEVTDFCNMENSGITHLSPLLHFSGKDTAGNVACFLRCRALKIAEGTFDGFANFGESGIEKIGELINTLPNADGYAINFLGCKSLKVAEGTFPGFVNFTKSGIKKIGKLAITNPSKNGYKANFHGCDIRLSAKFLGPEYLMDNETRRQTLTRIAATKAQKTAPDIEI